MGMLRYDDDCQRERETEEAITFIFTWDAARQGLDWQDLLVVIVATDGCWGLF